MALTKWVGWILFVGIVMIVSGLLSLIQGLVALFDDDFYMVTRDGLPVPVDYSVWGWTLIAFGVLLIGSGYAVMFGYTWARVVAMAVTFANALINLSFLAAFPIWSILAVSFDLIALYALAVHGGEGRLLRPERR
ncbi:DUF7144 family membrane protein [Paractinoplanes rishiriensis]|uniref:Membrane protein n=1 Tax=Paractinoplanes rishiriensis TaxID=1050105 RepID=A0A919K490_9ACTN|nr:hypothetical protein [Actinoplanes rishiriensis]GIE98494.1 membrane protein [Actinoplanes rishiriensis]